MNIIEMEDMVKGLPDQVLMQEAQAPSGRIPQFLALSEVQRRKDMRDRFQQQAPQATVKDQILQSGIAAALPQGPQMPPQGPPMGAPPGPPQGPVMAYGGGQMPYFMANGGQVPGMVRMQAGQTVPRMTRADRVNALKDQLQAAILAGATSEQINSLRSELEALTAPAPLTPQAQNYQTFQRIRQGNLFPQMQNVPVNMPAPDFSAQINAAIEPTTRGAVPASPTAPTAPDAAAAPAEAPGAMPPTSDIDMLSTFQQTAAGMRGAGAGSGLPTQAALKPYTDFFAIDPNNPALQAPSFAPFIAQQEARGKERAAAYEQSIKQIEEEMKRERLGAVLTTLGANLMAGEGAMGLEKAGAIAQQIGKEMRQEVGAERRAAKASEDATADRIFALNAQQLTADKEAQRALFTAQQGVKEKAFNAFSKVMDDQRQATQAANQLAATLTASAVNSMRDKIVTEGANARAVLDFAKAQANSLKETLGTSTVGMSAQDIQKIVEDAMRSAIITGYAAIGQAPPTGFESQIRSAPAASKPATGTQGSTASQSNDPFGVR
jgi:hypothetical protein